MYMYITAFSFAQSPAIPPLHVNTYILTDKIKCRQISECISVFLHLRI